MANSRCSCGASNFEMRELAVTAPTGGPTRDRYMAIQCATCGIVVGTHEGWYLGRVLEQMAAALKIQLK